MIALTELFKDSNFLRFINSLHEGMVCLNAAGEIIFCNRAAEKILGLTAEQLMGRSAMDPRWSCIHEDGSDFPADTRPSALALKTGQPQNNVLIGVIQQGTELKWVRVNAEPLFSGKNYQLSGVIESFVDITEQKKSEEKLKEREQLLLSIYETTANLIFVLEVEKNEKYKFLSVNKAFQLNTGIPFETVAGKYVSEIIPQPSLTLVLEKYKEAIREKKIVTWEETSQYPTGWLRGEVSITPVFGDEGNCIRLIGSVHDISEQKQAKEILKKYAGELQASNKELEQFAYIISHDLQEPLRMVSSFLELLQKKLSGQLDDASKQLIHFATDGAERMKKMIQDLLQYSRVNTNKEIYTATDLNEIMQYVTRVLDETIKKNQAVITVNSMPVITTNKTLITQLFLNLISNALKFRGDNPPQVEVNCTENQMEWIFRIKDNGIGIDPKFFEKIFLVFQRLHDKGKYPGTGIGLAICKRVVDLHKGKIWVESEPGKGSTFYFTIPKKIIHEQTN